MITFIMQRIPADKIDICKRQGLTSTPGRHREGIYFRPPEQFSNSHDDNMRTISDSFALTIENELQYPTCQNVYVFVPVDSQHFDRKVAHQDKKLGRKDVDWTFPYSLWVSDLKKLHNTRFGMWRDPNASVKEAEIVLDSRFPISWGAVYAVFDAKNHLRFNPDFSTDVWKNNLQRYHTEPLPDLSVPTNGELMRSQNICARCGRTIERHFNLGITGTSRKGEL